MKTFINRNGPVYNKMNHPLNTRNYRYLLLLMNKDKALKGKLVWRSVLRFQPLNKVPGNDRYQLSFTKCFEIPLETFKWNALMNHLLRVK